MINLRPFAGEGARATLSPAGRMAQIHRHVVVRRVSAADDFAGDDFLLVLALHQEIDRLAFERKQQRLGKRDNSARAPESDVCRSDHAE